MLGVGEKDGKLYFIGNAQVKAAAAPALAFGPVVERAVLFNGRIVTDLLDLDSGEIVSRPMNMEWEGIPPSDAQNAGVFLLLK